MAEVRLENVCKHFDDVVAVDNFNMSIKDKEFVVLVGPSGCGKTISSTSCRPKTATSRWYSRTMPSTPI